MCNGFRRNKIMGNDTAEDLALVSDAKASGSFARQRLVGNDVRGGVWWTIELALAGVGNVLKLCHTLSDFGNRHDFMVAPQVLTRAVGPHRTFRLRCLHFVTHERQTSLCVRKLKVCRDD